MSLSLLIPLFHSSCANDPKHVPLRDGSVVRRRRKKFFALYLTLMGKSNRHSFFSEQSYLMFMTLKPGRGMRRQLLLFACTTMKAAGLGGLGRWEENCFVVQSTENCLLRNWIVIWAPSSSEQQTNEQEKLRQWFLLSLMNSKAQRGSTKAPSVITAC